MAPRHATPSDSSIVSTLKLFPPVREAVVEVNKVRLFRTSVADLAPDELGQALAIFKGVDAALNSSHKKHPGRVAQLVERVKAVIAGGGGDDREVSTLIEKGTTKVTVRCTLGGVKFTLTTTTPDKVVDVERARALVESKDMPAEVKQQCYRSEKRINPDRLARAVELGLLTQAQFDSLCDVETVLDPAGLESVRELGWVTAEEYDDTLVAPGEPKLMLTHTTPDFVELMLRDPEAE